MAGGGGQAMREARRALRSAASVDLCVNVPDAGPYMLKISKRQARELLDFSPLWELHVQDGDSSLIMFMECDEYPVQPAVVRRPRATAGCTDRHRRDADRGRAL